jgi:hypothetical protein
MRSCHLSPQRKGYRFESLTEGELRRDVLLPLFRAMRYRDVTLYHGPNERGKDIVMWQADDFVSRVNFAVVAKRGPITGRADGGSDSASTTAFQIRQALGSPYTDPTSGVQQVVSRVLVVASGDIRPDSIAAILAGLDPSLQRAIGFINGERLEQLADEHLPSGTIITRAAEIQDAIRRVGDFPMEVRISRDATRIAVVPGAGTGQTGSLHGAIRLVDLSVPAGQAALARLQQHVRTGAAVTITRDMIDAVELPAILEQFGFDVSRTPDEVHIGARRGATAELLLDVEDPAADEIRLGPFQCDTIETGTERALLRSRARSHGWALELTIEVPQKSLLVALNFNLDGLNVREQLAGLRAQRALARGARVTIRAASSELPVAALNVPPGSVVEPEPVLIEVAEALAAAQAFIAKPLAMPGEGIDGETLANILELGHLLKTGVVETTWTSMRMVAGPDVAGNILTNMGSGRRGRFASRVVRGFRLQGQDVPVGIVESVADEATISPETEAHIRGALANGSASTEIVVIPARPDSRAVVRLLPLGTDEPVGG